MAGLIQEAAKCQRNIFSMMKFVLTENDSEIYSLDSQCVSEFPYCRFLDTTADIYSRFYLLILFHCEKKLKKNR